MNALEQLAIDLLAPDRYGQTVTAEVRVAAMLALGKHAVELSRPSMDAHHAKVRLALSEITGAAQGVLKAIHAAGGYVVFDPQHQGPIHQSISALEAAIMAAIGVASNHQPGD